MKPENNPQKNIEQTTPEELFAPALKTKLTLSEQSDMWEGLKNYAEYHTPSTAPQKTKVVPGPLAHLSRWYSGVAAAFLLIYATGVGASFSLPGEFLYPVKTEVTEPLLGTLRFSDAQQLEYLGQIIDNRLREMKELSKVNTLTELELVVLEDKITEHSNSIIEILSESTGEEPAAKAAQTVELLSEIVADLRTQEYIEDRFVSTTRQSKIEEAEDNLSKAYLEELTDFSENEPVEANVYIEEILDEIEIYVSDPEHVTESGTEVGDYLVDVTEALQSNDLEQALHSSSEAQQLIQLNDQIESLEEVKNTFE